MRHVHFFLAVVLLVCCGCGFRATAQVVSLDDTHTASAATIDTFTYNLPCQIITINPQQEGKALLFLWLHGGVHDRKIHSYFKHRNHWDNCAADDSIINYLHSHHIKAIALLPMCHKADSVGCVNWSDCFDDVRHMVDKYVSAGIVDPTRVYVAGSSDGGRGTWDFVADHPEMFAAAISMSCSEPRLTSVPTYFFNTSGETDCTTLVEQLKRQGSNILRYQYCPQYKHGGDAAMCTEELLNEFFSH